MEPLLTPRQLAVVVGASESSVRRWVDDGEIHVARTSGGHRRIPLSEALRFIRQSRLSVVRPDLLGFPTLSARKGPLDHAGQVGPDKHNGSDNGNGDGQSKADVLRLILESGDGPAAQGLMVGEYLDGEPLSAFFDGPLSDAMQKIGALWRNDLNGIVIEHRATDTCTQALQNLRGLIPKPAGTALRAVGGAVGGDSHSLASLMAALVLADLGFAVENYGADLPIDLLANEAERQEAALVWISWICPGSETAQQQVHKQLLAATEHLGRCGCQVVIGGRGWVNLPPTRPANLHTLANMSELAAFASGLQANRATLVTN
ncbi:MAG: excisionase family DNA-binding protein [Phycisphaeraceae bacterium]|nr:excisionase family DNA-binding protein [Phycisphaeraceae bacterium]